LVETEIVELALLPPTVVHASVKWVVPAGSAGVSTTPLTLVKPAFCEVNEESSGLETVQVFIPTVVQPSVVGVFAGTLEGLAVNMMLGCVTCTEHCAAVCC